MKYFGKVVNKTTKEIAVFLSGHPTVKHTILLQSGEASEVYQIEDEELVVKLLNREIGKANLIKMPAENSYSLLILIEFK